MEDEGFAAGDRVSSKAFVLHDRAERVANPAFVVNDEYRIHE
jgi:hypothetical protein